MMTSIIQPVVIAYFSKAAATAFNADVAKLKYMYEKYRPHHPDQHTLHILSSYQKEM